MRETRSTCPYCGVGCGVIIESEGTQIIGVRGDPGHPANQGRLCSKGSNLHHTAAATVNRQTRLLQPLYRSERGAVPQPLGWDAALNRACDGFARIIRQHGPDAVGFYVSGQLLTEDYYVFNKLAKGLVGSNNIDTNSRLCMSSAVAGYKQSLGADAPPACYDDVDHCATLFIVGSNTAYAHPVLFRRIEQARQRNPQLRMVVVDPRRTDTAERADLHLAIQPGTDVLLFNGMLHLMLWEGWTDAHYIARHTSGFDALKAQVRACTPEVVAQVCGIGKDALFQATRLFAGLDQGAADASGPCAPAGLSAQRLRSPTLSLYCQGLNQSSSGTAKNTALINLHLATGQIGKAGAGPFSLTGQPNAMGGREVGGLANLLSAHRDLANPAHRAEVAALWGVEQVPATPGKTAVDMFQAAADGQIKALWIACTNPAQSLPDQAMVRRALQRCELVVLQEAFATTATGAYADLLLPATTWGEKEGTVTNSERRISRVRAAVPPPRAPALTPDGPQPDGPRHDWAIAVDFAQRLEQALGRSGPSRFAYESPQAIWNEHRESTRGRDLDITGLSYAQLEAAPAQWPFPQGAQRGQARLYGDGVFATPDGRARFVASAYRPLAEPCDARYPFALNTGRLRDQWHGMSRTGTLGRLFGHVPEPALQMHPQDMQRSALQPGDLVRVSSRRGAIVLPVQPAPEQGAGQVFLAMHWGEEFVSGRSSSGARRMGVNALTTPVYCPDSRQPEFKHAAVQVHKAALPWSLLAMAWLDGDQVLAARQALQALMGEFDFATCVPFSGRAGSTDGGTGPERQGLLFRAASAQAPQDCAVLQRLELLLGLQGDGVLRYADARRGQRRAMRLHRAGADTRLEAFLLAGDTRAQAWISSLLQDAQAAQAYGRALLLPVAHPPVALPAQGRVVCTCWQVRDLAIRDTLGRCSGTPAERLAQLQTALACGTQCGSCLPELQRMVRETVPA